MCAKKGGGRGAAVFVMLLESKLNKQVFGGTSASCVGSQVLWSLGAQCVMEDALVYYCALFCGSADKQRHWPYLKNYADVCLRDP